MDVKDNLVIKHETFSGETILLVVFSGPHTRKWSAIFKGYVLQIRYPIRLYSLFNTQFLKGATVESKTNLVTKPLSLTSVVPHSPACLLLL